MFLIFSAAIIKGFGWGQRARAYPHPFTWIAVEGWIW
jgi:hypothetical protein